MTHDDGMDGDSDPYVRQARMRAAHDLYVEMAAVCNKHINAQGQHDPALDRILLAGFATLCAEIEETICPDFRARLAAMRQGGEEEDAEA